MSETQHPDRPTAHDQAAMLGDLDTAAAAVARIAASISAEQWSALTPCQDWTVRQVLAHLIGMDRVFTALLSAAAMPSCEQDLPADADLPDALVASTAGLRAAFARPGALEHRYATAMGTATGAQRLQIRVYDLLAHGWDLARATGQQVVVPDDVAQRSLAFARAQLADAARPGRFAPARAAGDDACVLEQLAAFLGRDTTG